MFIKNQVYFQYMHFNKREKFKVFKNFILENPSGDKAFLTSLFCFEERKRPRS